MKLKNSELLKPLKEGDIIKGRIFAKERRKVFLDLGRFGCGVVYGLEFLQAKDILKNLKPGDEVVVKTLVPKNEEGYAELSLREAQKDLVWQEFEEKKEKEETIKVKIKGANRGGLLTEIKGIPAFLPVSQLSSDNYPRVEGGNPREILKKLQKFIGKEMEVQILNCDPKTEKLILSEKLKEKEILREELKKYNVGDIVEGKVVGITDFGAFVEFGNPKVKGLIHVSQISGEPVENAAQVLKVGQNIKAKIVEISDEKIYLSLKEVNKNE